MCENADDPLRRGVSALTKTILVYADDPYSRTSSPTSTGIETKSRDRLR